mmetsp:Transcript_51282/g.148896  ORF Transcript_51282/g.148896 Transcript_51282/m.148896 type:complete len:138 (-) Transcript_51282:193-606(-)
MTKATQSICYCIQWNRSPGSSTPSSSLANSDCSDIQEEAYAHLARHHPQSTAGDHDKSEQMVRPSGAGSIEASALNASMSETIASLLTSRCHDHSCTDGQSSRLSRHMLAEDHPSWDLSESARVLQTFSARDVAHRH